MGKMVGWEITVLFMMFSSITALWEVVVGWLTFLNNILRGRKATWLTRVKEEILGLGIVSLVKLFIQPSLESVCIKGDTRTYEQKVVLLDNCPKGFHAAFPSALIYASHYLLFYVAVVHIIYNMLATVMTSRRLKGYSHFERHARGLDIIDPASKGKVDQASFLESKSWRIFTGSLDQDTYTIIRRLCIKRFQAHDIKTRHLNFINMCEQCMEAELDHVYSHAWLMILVMALLLLYPRKAEQVIWAPLMSTCALAFILLRLRMVLKKTIRTATIVLDKSKLLTEAMPDVGSNDWRTHGIQESGDMDHAAVASPVSNPLGEFGHSTGPTTLPLQTGRSVDNINNTSHGPNSHPSGMLPVQAFIPSGTGISPGSTAGMQAAPAEHSSMRGCTGREGQNGWPDGIMALQASPNSLPLRLDVNGESQSGALPWDSGSPGSSMLGGFSLHNNILGLMNPLLDHQTALQLQQQRDGVCQGMGNMLSHAAGFGALATAHCQGPASPAVWRMESNAGSTAGYVQATPDPHGPDRSFTPAANGVHASPMARLVPSSSANGVWATSEDMQIARATSTSPANGAWGAAEQLALARIASMSTASAVLSSPDDRGQALAQYQQRTLASGMSGTWACPEEGQGIAEAQLSAVADMEQHQASPGRMLPSHGRTSHRQHASLDHGSQAPGSASSRSHDRDTPGGQESHEEDLRVSVSGLEEEQQHQAKVRPSESRGHQPHRSKTMLSVASSDSSSSAGSDMSVTVKRRHASLRAKKSVQKMLKDLEHTISDLFYFRSPRLMLWIFNLIYIESSLSITIAVALQIPYDKFEKFKEVTQPLPIWIPFVFLELLITIYLSSVIIPMHAMITTAATSDPLEVIEDIQENKTQSSEEGHGISGLVLGVFNRVFIGAHEGESNLATAFISALAEQSGLVLSKQHNYKSELYHPRVLNVFKELLVAWHGVALYGKPAEPQPFEATLVRFRTAFAELDEDGSGSLSFRELANMIRSLGTFVTESDIESMLWEVDEDGSQSIGFDEFTKFLAYSFFEENSVSGFGLDAGGLLKASEKMKLQPTEEECEMMLSAAGCDDETRTIGPKEFFAILDHIQFGE